MFKLNPFRKRSPDQSSTSAESTQDNLPFTEEGIRARAQQIYERRKAQGLKGTPEGDWKQSIRELKWERSLLAKFGRWTGLGQKKGWDLFTSLSLPVVLFVGGSLFTYWNNQQQQRIADDNRKQEILNKYLDQMAESLKDGLLKAQPGSEKFVIAQARTITTLLSVDKRRQSLLIQFLSASGLNQIGNKVAFDKNGKMQLGKDDRVLLYRAQMAKTNLTNSDLSGALLIESNLSRANVGCIQANSRDLNQCSDLSSASLLYANLREANLKGANLNYAVLENAHLYRANLENAVLWRADLKGADLRGVNFRGAYLDKTNLSHALLLLTDLKDSESLIQKQLEGKEGPLVCNVRFPKGIGVNPDRDCDRIPQELVKRFPDVFPNLQAAQKHVDAVRQYKWE